MRTSAFVMAAVAAVLVASPAFAGNDTTNIQVGNGLNIRSVTVGANLNANGSGDASGLAIGNLVTINSPYPASQSCTGTQAYGKPVCTNDTAFSSFQTSVGSNIGSTVGLVDVKVGADLTVGSQAINNHGSFSSDTGKLAVKTWQDTTIDSTGDLPTNYPALATALAYQEATAIQIGDFANVTSTFYGLDLTSGGDFDGSSLAVGNNLSFKAHANTSAVAFQTGNGNNVISLAGVADLNAVGDVSLTSTAINNNASWQTKVGGADGINFQYGSGVNVTSAAGLVSSNIGANLNLGSVAAGNIAQIGNY